MGIEAPARVKYALIREAAERDGNMLNVSWMCRIAGVTRSGYYAWLDAAPARQSVRKLTKETLPTSWKPTVSGAVPRAHEAFT